MSEPRTHYQVSFTSRQAVSLFAVALAALTGAYFLGLLAGLAGRQPGESEAAAVPAPDPTASATSGTASVVATAGIPPATAPPAAQERASPPSVAAREPGTEGGLQFFEDRPEEPTRTTPAPAGQAAAQAQASPGFFVQILSTRSEREASSRRALLSRRGYRAIVEPVTGGKGPVLYRVRVGPYASHEEASKAAQVLARNQKGKTWIVRPEQ